MYMYMYMCIYNCPPAKFAHVRQSRPDYGLDLQVKVLQIVEVVPYLCEWKGGFPDFPRERFIGTKMDLFHPASVSNYAPGRSPLAMKNYTPDK